MYHAAATYEIGERNDLNRCHRWRHLKLKSQDFKVAVRTSQLYTKRSLRISKEIAESSLGPLKSEVDCLNNVAQVPNHRTFLLPIVPNISCTNY